MEKSIATFDEHGLYELHDDKLLAVVSTHDLRAASGGAFDAGCAQVDVACGNDIACGNVKCFNTTCIEGGVNTLCNQDINAVCP